MEIPDYQSLMLPVLMQHADQKDHKTSELLQNIVQEFNLSQQDVDQLLPSGKGKILDNRLGWARTYLKKAGLIESPFRSATKITARGLEVLESKPEKINVKFLKKFPEFNRFWALKPEKKEKTNDKISDEDPQERIETAYQEIKANLVSEVLEKLKNQTPKKFEETVLIVLQKMGYGASIEDSIQHTGKSGDGGIDGIIKEDYLGLDKIYIQAKRWEGVVSRPEIDKFIGVVAENTSKKGIFITTSDFSDDALQKAKRHGVILINGPQLAEHMIKYNVGVSLAQEPYEIKRIDTDFFNEE